MQVHAVLLSWLNQHLYQQDTQYLWDIWEVHTKFLSGRAVRRIQQPKEEKETKGWRTLHSGQLHNSYSLPTIRALQHKMHVANKKTDKE